VFAPVFKAVIRSKFSALELISEAHSISAVLSLADLIMLIEQPSQAQVVTVSIDQIDRVVGE